MRAMSRFVLRHKGAVVVILLDATVVRALLVPALIALLGTRNWWLPRPAQRLLRVTAPPPPAQPADATAQRLTTEPAHRELGAHG